MKPDAPFNPLSTSQKTGSKWVKPGEISDSEYSDIQVEIEYSEHAKTLACTNNAPYIFFIDRSDTARLVLGCCNDWTCPRCGHLRALHEYGRIVNGARTVADDGQSLYFLTLTCRGREVTAKEADDGYLLWTNRLLSTARAKQKVAGLPWMYAQVTERQKRGHPHSHLITTFCPDDVEEYQKGTLLPNGATATHDTLYSAWLTQACIRAGLGRMVDLSYINNPVAVAVYASKYMFKEAVSTAWPKGWRRVRYSQSWPQLPDPETKEGFPLIHFRDWLRMQALGVTVHADTPEIVHAARLRLISCVI